MRQAAPRRREGLHRLLWPHAVAAGAGHLKAAVTQASRYAPKINDSYSELAPPHALVGQTLDLCITATTAELPHKDKRVASHSRYG